MSESRDIDKIMLLIGFSFISYFRRIFHEKECKHYLA